MMSLMAQSHDWVDMKTPAFKKSLSFDRVVDNFTKNYHFSFSFVRHPHFFEHLITLFHQQRPLVGVFGNGRVVQFHYVNVSLDPTGRGVAINANCI